MLYSRRARCPLAHRGQKPFRWNSVDVHVFVLIRNVGNSTVACPLALDSVQDHACDDDKEEGAERRTERDEDCNAIRVAEVV